MDPFHTVMYLSQHCKCVNGNDGVCEAMLSIDGQGSMPSKGSTNLHETPARPSHMLVFEERRPLDDSRCMFLGKALAQCIIYQL